MHEIFFDALPLALNAPIIYLLIRPVFHRVVSLQEINSMRAQKKNPPFLQRNLRNDPYRGLFVLVEKLCMVCARLRFRARTFLLPPALEWATIPRCHFPAVRGPAIPKRTRTVCRGEVLAPPRARIRRLKKDELEPAFHSLFTPVEIA